MAESRPGAAPRGRGPPRHVYFFAAALLALLAALAAWKWWPRAQAPPPGGQTRPAPEDPRRTFATPYRNVRPGVRYVGDEACAACHGDKAETYRRHPMGRSFAPVASAEPLERYDPAAHNPFDRFGSHFLVERQGERVSHKEVRQDPRGRVLAEVAAEVQFALGSGARGRSYLIDRGGYLFQSPISWY